MFRERGVLIRIGSMTAPRILLECLEPHHMQVRSGIISSSRLILRCGNGAARMESASSGAEEEVAEKCKVGSLCNKVGGPLASPLIAWSGTFSPKRRRLRHLSGVDGGSWEAPNVRFHTSINS